jgi:hypothetical protein
MNRAETALLLAKIAAGDNRRLDPADANLDDPASTPILTEWHQILGDLHFAMCVGAVTEHRRTSTEWLQPAHIRRIVMDRWHAANRGIPDWELTEDINPHNGRAYVDTLQFRRNLIAQGATLEQAKATPPPPQARYAIVDRKATPVITEATPRPSVAAQ